MVMHSVSVFRKEIIGQFQNINSKPFSLWDEHKASVFIHKQDRFLHLI